MDRRWVPLAEISPRLAEAVIAAEDNLFCRHHGFDWESLGEVIAEYEPGEPSRGASTRSEEHTSELQSLMRISYAVFCLKKKKKKIIHKRDHINQPQKETG